MSDVTNLTDLTLSGDLVVGDDVTVAGDITITGATTFNGAVEDITSTSSGAYKVLSLANIVTLAQLKAGKALITGVTGYQIRPLNFRVISTGSFTTGTSLIIQSDNDTPVVISTTLVAGLTDGAVILPDESNTTLGAGFGALLGSGDGVEVEADADMAAGTSLLVLMEYTIEPVSE